MPSAKLVGSTPSAPCASLSVGIQRAAVVRTWTGGWPSPWIRTAPFVATLPASPGRAAGTQPAGAEADPLATAAASASRTASARSSENPFSSGRRRPGLQSFPVPGLVPLPRTCPSIPSIPIEFAARVCIRAPCSQDRGSVPASTVSRHSRRIRILTPPAPAVETAALLVPHRARPEPAPPPFQCSSGARGPGDHHPSLRPCW